MDSDKRKAAVDKVGVKRKQQPRKTKGGKPRREDQMFTGVYEESGEGIGIGAELIAGGR